MSNDADYQLLKIKERLSENLSSPQIIKTLDDLLYRALKPLIQNTDFIDYTLVELLPHVYLNKRRKFANKPFAELTDNLFSIIMLSDRTEKLDKLAKQGLERSVFLAALFDFEKSAKEYLYAIKKQLESVSKQEQVKSIDVTTLQQRYFVHDNLYETAQTSVFWLAQAVTFKQMIVEKYIRHARNEAKKMVAQTNLQIDANDLFRDLVLSIHKAIDKYDPQKGPLTSYVNNWFMEAKTNYRNAHEYGVAYNMPTGKRKKMIEDGNAQSITLELNDAIAESVSDDTQDILSKLIADEHDVTTNNLVCRADTGKVYSLLSEIQYTLTPEDVEYQKHNKLELENV